jgi:hypothetical protein
MDWAGRFAAIAQSNANAAGSFPVKIMQYSLQPSIWDGVAKTRITTAILHPLNARFKAKIDSGLKMVNFSTVTARVASLV